MYTALDAELRKGPLLVPSANEVSRSGWQQLQWVSPSRTKLRGLSEVKGYM